MSRRIHVPHLSVGPIALSEREAHHARDVLRLRDGQAVEVFDDTGAIGEGTLRLDPAAGVSVSVASVRPAAVPVSRLAIASAIPKGPRADWLVEKLSELGVDAFIPLETARSVVMPEGKNKLERWSRLATEAAKQSRRAGVMRIGGVLALSDAVEAAVGEGEAWHLSTSTGASPIIERLCSRSGRVDLLTLFVGPEGGWTPEETDRFEATGVPAASLGETILRIETAAVAAAAITMAVRSARLADSTIGRSPLESRPE